MNEIFTKANIELLAGSIGALAIIVRFTYLTIKLLVKAQKESNMGNQIANIRTASIPAATAVVGYDLLTGERDARVPFARKLDTIALVGSAAAGDTIIELFVQGQSVGKYSNSSTGVSIDRTKDMIPLNIYVGANELIEAKVIDAASTNPVVLQLEFDKPEYNKTYRRSYRRSGGSRPAAGGGRWLGR